MGAATLGDFYILAVNSVAPVYICVGVSYQNLNIMYPLGYPSDQSVLQVPQADTSGAQLADIGPCIDPPSTPGGPFAPGDVVYLQLKPVAGPNFGNPVGTFGPFVVQTGKTVDDAAWFTPSPIGGPPGDETWLLATDAQSRYVLLFVDGDTATLTRTPPQPIGSAAVTIVSPLPLPVQQPLVPYTPRTA